MSHFRTNAFSVLVLGLVALAIAGCDKNSDPAGPQPMSINETNLFPFAAGRLLVYNEYTLDATTGVKTSGTDHRHTIHAAGTTTWTGKTAFLIVDSTYNTSGTVVSVDTTYAAIEGGNLYISMENTWGLLFDRSRGTETEYSVASYVDTSLGFPVTVHVTATIHNKATLLTPGGTFSAYKVDFTGSVTLGGSTYLFPQVYYFADGVGIVRATTPPTTTPGTTVKEPGEEMVYVSKNF
jgi:hypothetical protein